jgi:hypothetical protein
MHNFTKLFLGIICIDSGAFASFTMKDRVRLDNFSNTITLGLAECEILASKFHALVKPSPENLSEPGHTFRALMEKYGSVLQEMITEREDLKMNKALLYSRRREIDAIKRRTDIAEQIADEAELRANAAEQELARLQAMLGQ